MRDVAVYTQKRHSSRCALFDATSLGRRVLVLFLSSHVFAQVPSSNGVLPKEEIVFPDRYRALTVMAVMASGAGLAWLMLQAAASVFQALGVVLDPVLARGIWAVWSIVLGLVSLFLFQWRQIRPDISVPNRVGRVLLGSVLHFAIVATLSAAVAIACAILAVPAHLMERADLVAIALWIWLDWSLAEAAFMSLFYPRIVLLFMDSDSTTACEDA